MGQKIGRYISIVILVLSSALGVWNGLSDWEIDRTALQASVTVGVWLAFIGRIRRRRDADS